MPERESNGSEGGIPWYPEAQSSPAVAPGFGHPTETAYGNLGGSPTGSRKRRIPVLLGAVLAAALIAAVLAIALPGGGKSAQAAVIASVNNAVASKTARGNLTMSIDSGKLAGSGAGTIDFTNGAMDFNLTLHLANVDQSLPVHLIFLGGTMYEGFPQIGQSFPGKSWVSLDLSGVANSGGGGALNLGGNPAAMLRLLSDQGNHVESVGATSVAGVEVTGYRITFDDSAIQRQLSSGLPSWIRGAVSRVSLKNATETVYIDTSGQLRRTAIHVEVNDPSGKTTGVDETFDLSDYGIPVSISAPPADQVVDLQQVIQGLGSGSGA